MIDRDVIELSPRVPASEMRSACELRSFRRRAVSDFLRGFPWQFGALLEGQFRLRALVCGLTCAVESWRVRGPQVIHRKVAGRRESDAGYFDSAISCLVTPAAWLEPSRLA